MIGSDKIMIQQGAAKACYRHFISKEHIKQINRSTFTNPCQYSAEFPCWQEPFVIGNSQ